MEVVALDTNTVIAGFRGDESNIDGLDAAKKINIPATVAGEQCFGAFKSKKLLNNIKGVGDFVSQFKMIKIDMEVSVRYGVIKADL